MRRQTVSHDPQWLLSLVRSVQIEPAPTILHSVKPLEHSMLQLPATHTGSPPTAPGHCRQFAPHCVVDVSETQLPLQLCVFGGHAGTQRTPSQLTSPPGGATHGVHAAPHVATEVSLTHWPSQSCVSRGHWHCPA